MLILDAAETRQALPMPAAIEGMKQAYAALTDRRVQMPLRAHLDSDQPPGVSLVMPARVELEGETALAVKVVSVFPENRALGLPTIQGAVLVIDPKTGLPEALLEGSTLTAIRTGAGSGAATDVLARADVRTAAILGTGVQARTQLEAVCCVRDIRTVWVYSPNPERRTQFAEQVAGESRVPVDVRVAATASEAVRDADVICTATTSTTPVFDDNDVRSGTHVNAVGSYQPHVQEVPDDTTRRAKVFVDNREAAWSETGDLLQPLDRGVISRDHVYADLGETVLGRRPGRESPVEITLFKSVGLAVQDAVAARVAIQQARARGLGTEVAWTSGT